MGCLPRRESRYEACRRERGCVEQDQDALRQEGGAGAGGGDDGEGSAEGYPREQYESYSFVGYPQPSGAGECRGFGVYFGGRWSKKGWREKGGRNTPRTSGSCKPASL